MFFAPIDHFDANTSIDAALPKIPSTFMWNSMMKSRSGSGLYPEVLGLYRQMTRLGIKPDNYTIPIVIKAVTLLDVDVALGEMVHCVAAKTGIDLCLYFCNTIIPLYGKSGFICAARKVFEEMPVRDSVSWTSIISEYVYRKDAFTAFQLFRNMQFEMPANSVTAIVLARCCWGCDYLIGGKQIHCFSTKNGLANCISVRNWIFRVYCKMGTKAEVEKFFTADSENNIEFFNILIEFLCKIGCLKEALDHFRQLNIEGVLSCETVTLLLPILAESAYLTTGEILHCLCIKRRIWDDILLTALLHFYAIFGNLRSSARLLEEITFKSNVTWNAMMSGYIHNECHIEAVELFFEMEAYDAEILTKLVDALSFMGLQRHGRAIHGHVIRNNVENLHLSTSILRMYSRNGNNVIARKWFDVIKSRDVVTWTAMIEGYGASGEAFEGLNLFDQMVREGFPPNEATFLSLLCGCSHCGFVSVGCEVFIMMKWVYKMEPNLGHYTCMVDLLGRCGRLKEALSMILKMRVDADGRIWGALLGACRVHGNARIGQFAARKLVEIECDNAGYYAVLGNVMCDFGDWERAEQIRKIVNKNKYRIIPARSSIVS